MAGGGRVKIKGGIASNREAVVEDGALLVTGITAGAATFLSLTDTPAAYAGAALFGVRVNAGATALEFAALADTTLQEAYDAATAPSQIVLNGTPDALTIEASVAGDIFNLETSTDEILSVDNLGIDFGPSARRLQRMNWLNSTGRFGTELWPDDFSITTATGVNMAFYTLAARTITLAIPGGGGLGNETAPGGMSFTHTARFTDQGFVFASQLLINAAVQIECAANVGPLYLFLDQYKTYADGGARTCTQHNALRAQPSWGPNINGGSITQTSAQLFFAFASVNATVGSATVTTMDYFAAISPSLVAGGTIGTLSALNIANLSGPTTIYGINSAMSSGTFIRQAGTAISTFAGDIVMGTNVPLVLGAVGTNNIELLRPTGVNALRMIGDGGAFDEALEWYFNGAAGSVRVDSSTGANLWVDTDRVSLGTADPGGTNNWFLSISAPTDTVTLAGDHAHVLNPSGGVHTIDAALSNFFQWIVNAPTGAIGTGSVTNSGTMLVQTNTNVGTQRPGLLITSNPSGGTLNYALRVTAGDCRFDGRVDINNGIALGGGAAATLGTIGGAGPTAAAQAQWVEIDIGGVAHWIAVWT